MSPWERTKLICKIVITCIIGLVVLYLMKGCDKRKINDIATQSLKPNEQAAIIIGPNGQIESIERANGGRASLRPSLLLGGKSEPSTHLGSTIEWFKGARGIRFSIDETGNVTATARYYGFTFEPGIGVFASPRNTGVNLDVQVAFYKQHGINLGVIVNTNKEVRVFTAYSYTLPFKYFSNTSVLIGIDNQKEILIGTRVKF